MSPFTTDPALKLQAIAEAIATALERVPGLNVLSYDPIGAEIDDATACVGESTTGERTGIDEAEQQLGSDDWDEEWTVRLYIALDDPASAWPLGRRLTALIVRAIDFDYQLGGEVREARITEWSLAPDEPEDGKRRKLVGEFTVSLKYLMRSGATP